MHGQTQPVLQRPPGYRSPIQPVQPPPTGRVFPNTYRPKRRRRSFCRTCCFCLCISLLFLILILIVVGGIVYLFFKPELPSFHIKSLNFRRFNITNNPDGAYLDCETVLGVEAKNPNHELRLIYDRIAVTMSVEDYELGTASVPGFIQGKNNVTMLRFKAEVKNMMIDTGTATKMVSGYRTKSLAVSTVVSTMFGLGVGGWNSDTVKVKVSCGKATLKEIFSGDMPKCKLTLLDW
ncbi:NDR1/HIN1-like protein 6 [Cornus florida]|uniref:NDR1/HIN1-like protein 6 n=1 Tax=Cornus florida TaxID=4283 RepID=UPI002898EF62|nr:NDR1/HIN1-like protein 6 [Cornus florida]